MSTALNTSVTPQFRTIDGLQIRFAERAAGASQNPTILLTSYWYAAGGAAPLPRQPGQLMSDSASETQSMCQGN